MTRQRSKITAGCRVLGRFGDLIDPPGGPSVDSNGKKKRRVRRVVYGTVVASSGLRKWRVRFDHNNEIRENLSSNQLKVVDNIEGVPIISDATATVSKNNIIHL